MFHHLLNKILPQQSNISRESDDIDEPIRGIRELETFLANQSEETRQAIHKVISFILYRTPLQ